jgi:tRNA nucleotidyltransferase (CCA-adding enzyme)
MIQRAFPIPPSVVKITETLEKGGFEANLVGGCVRDLLLKRAPKDWDIATNATPEQIQGLFENTFYENKFGTVGVVSETEEESLKVVEVTPYRLEGEYSDARRPDSVIFSHSLEDDLKRRDFTINAFAYNISQGHLVDLHKGQVDLESRVIRTVGKAKDRFAEDALRMLRAVRLASELSFAVEPETEKAILENASLLSKISKERIRDEFVRILLSDKPMDGVLLMRKLGILPYVLPDLERGVGIDQNQAHKYDVWEHNLRTLQHAADKKWSLELRLAGLLHDISKPETRRFSDEKKDWTFYGHDVVGGRVSKKILTDLKFPAKTIEKVSKLVRWHMFFSDPDQITLSAVRRTIRNVGEENIDDLLDLRVCDRIGTGRPKEQPFRFRKYKSMVEEARRDPISVGMLALDGGALMETLGEKPGPRIGWILHALLEEVLEDPAKNTVEYLRSRAGELAQLSDTELKSMGEKGKEKKEASEEEKIKQIRSKYWVE